MQKYSNLESKIKIKFKDKELLNTVFVHKSYLNEHKNEKIEDNERLEFLGDAVLELVTTEYLYNKFPNKQEGELTSWRAALVRGLHLANIAQYLELGAYLFLSRGEEKSGGREKGYILANTIEALIGAIYLDRGFKPAKEFISKFILTDLEEILKRGLHKDAKSILQEISQDKKGVTPEYKVVSETGPDHDKIFVVEAFLGDKKVGKGEGKSKQNAEQNAAEDALGNLGWG
jgi:ribonuclease III